MIKVESVTLTLTMSGEEYQDLCDYMTFARKHREDPPDKEKKTEKPARPKRQKRTTKRTKAEPKPSQTPAPAADPKPEPDPEVQDDDPELDETVKKILAVSKSHPLWDTKTAEEMAKAGDPWTNIAVELGQPYKVVQTYLKEHGYEPQRGRKHKEEGTNEDHD